MIVHAATEEEATQARQVLAAHHPRAEVAPDAAGVIATSPASPPGQ